MAMLGGEQSLATTGSNNKTTFSTLPFSGPTFLNGNVRLFLPMPAFDD
jgi:hypothetical protein